MPLLLIGIALLVMKWLEIEPIAQWGWWWFLVPFALTTAWWTWSDASGLTRRRAERKAEERTQERRRRSMSFLGLDMSARDKDRNKGGK